MKVFLRDKIYVKNEDNLIYCLEYFEVYDKSNNFILNLNLVAGWDYINPDISNEQGYVPANRFVEDVQLESITCYFLTEGINECLEDNGYEILNAEDLSAISLVRI